MPQVSASRQMAKNQGVNGSNLLDNIASKTLDISPLNAIGSSGLIVSSR